MTWSPTARADSFIVGAATVERGDLRLKEPGDTNSDA